MPMAECSFYLTSFYDSFGSLTNSTVSRDEVIANLRWLWTHCCIVLDNQLKHSSADTIEHDRIDLEDLRRAVRLHGLETQAFQGKHFALDEEGNWIPQCAEKPSRDLMMTNSSKDASSRLTESKGRDPQRGL